MDVRMPKTTMMTRDGVVDADDNCIFEPNPEST